MNVSKSIGSLFTNFQELQKWFVDHDPVCHGRTVPVRYVEERDFLGGRIEVNNRVCRVCDTPFKRDLKLNQHIPDNHACDSCRHWNDMWQLRNDPDTVRIKGNHYMISNQATKGFGGRKFKIRFHDGRVVETNNLWHQGRISSLWVMFGLTDNAEFEND